MMQNIYPSFYKKFKCIANLCEDSCCKDWDIDIDSQTEEFYKTVRGGLGDKLRQKLVTDDDGERVFKAENGRCPFWNRDMLCDIFIGIGEEHLSETCAKFPRVKVDYSGFRENLLSFACPEAARFMLAADDGAYADFGNVEENGADGDDYMSFLLKARSRTAAMMLDREVPFEYRLADCLEFNAQVQAILNGEEPAPLKAGVQNSCRFILDMHTEFEIMSGRWREALNDILSTADALEIRPDFALDFEKFALYYIYRYYLEAINSGDVLYSMKRIVCAYIVTGKLDADFAQKGYPLPRMRILQRYSKEVEHSYENTEALNARFDSDPRFSIENLITMLEAMV